MTPTAYARAHAAADARTPPAATADQHPADAPTPYSERAIRLQRGQAQRRRRPPRYSPPGDAPPRRRCTDRQIARAAATRPRIPAGAPHSPRSARQRPTLDRRTGSRRTGKQAPARSHTGSRTAPRSATRPRWTGGPTAHRYRLYLYLMVLLS